MFLTPSAVCARIRGDALSPVKFSGAQCVGINLTGNGGCYQMSGSMLRSRPPATKQPAGVSTSVTSTEASPCAFDSAASQEDKRKFLTICPAVQRQKIYISFWLAWSLLSIPYCLQTASPQARRITSLEGGEEFSSSWGILFSVYFSFLVIIIIIPPFFPFALQFDKTSAQIYWQTYSLPVRSS